MKPIEELDLSVSSYNRLKMAGIDTVEQLQNMDECQLLRLRHMTQRNVGEITQKVRLCAVTNADHIRSMTDEELAYFLHGIYCEGHANGISHIYDAMLPHYKELLKQPYGGDT